MIYKTDFHGLNTDNLKKEKITDLFCQSCHFSKIWQEWQETTHAKSWKDPEFKKLANQEKP